MGWSSGTYTKGNAATGGWAGDAAANIGIEAGRHDTQDNDFQNGINNCLTKDGQNTPTANLPMGGYKHTGVANASNATDYMAYGQIRNGAPLYMDTTNNRLGIGTSTPSTILDIQATATAQTITGFSADTLAPVINFQKSRGATVGTNTIVQNGDYLGSVNFYGANGTGYSPAASMTAFVDGVPGATTDMPGRLSFWTSPDGTSQPQERMRIDNAGKVGIGDNPASNAHLYSKSSVSGRAAARFFLNAASNEATPAIWLDKWDTSTTTSQVFLQATVNNQTGQNGQINANGASQLAFGTWSDRRLKENIQDLPSQLNNFLTLRPVEFDYKDGSGHQIGFIAQEVQVIFPDLVGENSEGMLTLSGLGKWESRLVKAIQELNAKVESLEARVAELEK